MFDFNKKPIIGMIHLAGGESAVARALTEIEILYSEGCSGCIIENYHHDEETVVKVLEAIYNNHPLNFEIGINLLPNEFVEALTYAKKYNASFIQMDYITGEYEHRKPIDLNKFSQLVHNHKPIKILGGVWPKYYTPVKDSSVEEALLKAVTVTDAIVVTGKGTGQETSIEKVRQFKNIIGGHPLIVGAGLTVQNVFEQLSIADGGIVGSAFKPSGATTAKILPSLVREFMSEVKR